MVLAPDSAAYLAEVARLGLSARTIDEMRVRYIAVSGIDSLRDEGMRFAQKLPSPTLVCHEGEVHGFLTYAARFQASGDVVERIAAYLRASVPASASDA